MRNIFFLAIIGGVFGSEPDTDSLLQILHRLRVKEGGPWIDMKTYNLLLEEGKRLGNAVKDDECRELSDEASLVDSMNQCFGKSRENSITARVQFLLRQSCKLAEGPSPPTTPTTFMNKFVAYFNEIRTEVVPDDAGSRGPSGGNRELLRRIIAEKLVALFHGKEACSNSLTPRDINYQCPVSHDRPVSPNWDSVGFPQNEIGEEMKSTVKTLYENLLNRDCILYRGIDQTFRDTKRNPLRDKLLDVIRHENMNEDSVEAGAGPASAAAISDAPHQTLSESIAANLAEIAEHDSNAVKGQLFREAVKGQLFREIRQMFETCSEAGLVYSLIGRNATSELNTFYDGRPMEGKNSSQRWRKFSYPKRTDRKIFHYYQGIADVCYFVMFYERKPPGLSSPAAIYPGKHEMFNVIATVVENIHDLPVGDTTVETPYHQSQAEGVFGLVNSVYGLSIPLSTDTEMMTTIGGYLSNIILRTFISENAPLNWVPVSETDATPRLKKLWFFVFQHGHYGMMAFIVAAYKKLAGSHKSAPDVLQELLYPLRALSGGSLFQDALTEAENIIAGRSPLKWGDHDTFAQFIDEIEMGSILKIRP